MSSSSTSTGPLDAVQGSSASDGKEGSTLSPALPNIPTAAATEQTSTGVQDVQQDTIVAAAPVVAPVTESDISVARVLETAGQTGTESSAAAPAEPDSRKQEDNIPTDAITTEAPSATITPALAVPVASPAVSAILGGGELAIESSASLQPSAQPATVTAQENGNKVVEEQLVRATPTAEIQAGEHSTEATHVEPVHAETSSLPPLSFPEEHIHPTEQQASSSSASSISSNPISRSSSNRPQRRTGKKEESARLPSTSATSANGTNGKRTSGRNTSEKPPSSSSRTRGASATSTSSKAASSSKGKSTSRSRRAAGAVTKTEEVDEEAAMDIDGEEGGLSQAGNGQDGDEGVTRCICGNNDDESPDFMIQCEDCKAWQHGPCVGYRLEKDCPETYYCELCRPELHTHHSSVRGKKGQQQSRSGRSTSVHSGEGREKASSKPSSRDASHSGNTVESVPAQPQPPTPGSAAANTSHSSSNASASRPTHKPRASADAIIVSSFLEQQSVPKRPSPPASTVSAPPVSNTASTSASISHTTTTRPAVAHTQREQQASHSPSPGAGIGHLSALASDGKRPMYPSTSHLSAPAQPKRRSTMNSRESVAWDESIALANAAAMKESRRMEKERKKKRKLQELQEQEQEDSDQQEENDDDDDKGGEDAADEEDMPIKEEQEDDHLLESKAESKSRTPARSKSKAKAKSRTSSHKAKSQSPADNEAMDLDEPAGEVNEGEHEESREQGEETSAAASSSKKKLTAAQKRQRKAASASAAAKKSAGLKTSQVDIDEAAASEGEDNDAHATAQKQQRKRKAPAHDADDTSALLGQPSPTSPSGSIATNESSTSSSDRPLAAASGAQDTGSGAGPAHLLPHANKRRKQQSQLSPSQSTIDLPEDSDAAGAGQSAQGSTRPALASLTIGQSAGDSDLATLAGNESNAPSPAASASTTATGSLQPMSAGGADSMSTAGGLAPPAAGRGKRAPKGVAAVEETEEEIEDDNATPAPQTGSAPASNAAKAKHPNQYTYRQRGSGSARGTHRTSPSKRGAHARDDYRDETPGGGEEWSATQSLTWALPDHLTHLAHLLPGQSPQLINVPVAATTASGNSKGGSKSTQGSPIPAAATIASPAADSPQQANGLSPTKPELHTQPEVPTKIRFPARRTSMTEMRKRAKNVLDYLARVQVEMVERNQRSRALAALSEKLAGYQQRPQLEHGGQSSSSSSASSIHQSAAATDAVLTSIYDPTATPASALMIDDLTRQINSFQEKFS